MAPQASTHRLMGSTLSVSSALVRVSDNAVKPRRRCAAFLLPQEITPEDTATDLSTSSSRRYLSTFDHGAHFDRAIGYCATYIFCTVLD